MRGTYRRYGDRLHNLSDVPPLVLRVVAGWIFILHALFKYDNGIEGFEAFLRSLGSVPLPEVASRVVPLLELIGGVALIVGFATRPFALILGLEMVFTGFVAKLTNLNTGVLGPNGVGGAEVDLLYLAIFVTLVVLGPGRVSLDAWAGLESRGHRPVADLPAP